MPRRSQAVRRPAADRKTAAPPARDTVLFAVTGMSPAVLTETVWALATGPNPIIPREVVVVTTAAGRDRLEQELFGTRLGRHPHVWHALHAALAERGLDVRGRLHLARPHGIHVFSRPSATDVGTEHLADIRTAADNETAGDFLLRTLRGYTDDDDTQVIASIAGGRKTMGALLYAVMSLVGREVDRLTHVLVNEPFDAPTLHPRFYFPAQPGGALRCGTGRAIPPARARLELADVPFVPLREVFPRELGQRPGRFMALVERYRQSTPLLQAREVTIRLDPAGRTLWVGHREFQLSARQAVVLEFLVRQARDQQPPLDRYDLAGPAILAARGWDRSGFEESRLNDDERQVLRDLRGDATRFVIKALDDFKSKLRKAADPDVDALLRALPARGRFGLRLPPRCLEVIS